MKHRRVVLAMVTEAVLTKVMMGASAVDILLIDFGFGTLRFLDYNPISS